MMTVEPTVRIQAGDFDAAEEIAIMSKGRTDIGAVVTFSGLCREILVSGLREYLAALKVSVPVTQLAKWKTAIQMVAIAFLLLGPAGDKLVPYWTQTGIGLLWISAIVTLYTGYDYFRAGLKHIVDE